MPPIKDHEALLLRLAQFKEINSGAKFAYDKSTELLLQDLDLNMTIPDTSFLKDHDKDSIGRSLLHLAYSEDNIEMYKVLISKGADFNMKDKEGNSVLHRAFHRFCSVYHSRNHDTEVDKINDKKFITPVLSAHVKNKNINNPSDSDGLTHFHIACGTNDVEAVEVFLQNNSPEQLKVLLNQPVASVGINKYFKGYTPLHFAAEFGYVELTRILLKYGANTNLENDKGQTPLHLALEKNIEILDSELHRDVELNEEVIDLLLKNTISPKLPDLFVACGRKYSYHYGTVSESELNVNQSINADSKVWPGYTALHFAAHASVDTVKLLLKDGANINVKAANGVTPFDMCVDRYSVEDIRDILCLVPNWKNIVLSDGKTKLIDLLSTLKNSEKVHYFLNKSKENMTLFVPRDSPIWPGFTVLHLAVLLTERTKCKTDYKIEEGKTKNVFDPSLSIITECLKQDNADVTITDHCKQTPIHLAFRLDKQKTLNLLLQHHHRTKNCTDEQNLSHLHIACVKQNTALVKTLVWNEADTNTVYTGDLPISSVYPGWTPLHVAIHKQNSNITKLLLQFGADIYLQDTHGFTPIHRLISCPYLTDLGAIAFSKPNLHDFVVDDIGLSYLHIACAVGDIESVKQLLDLGADVNKVLTCTQNEDENYPSIFGYQKYNGSTPLHFALADYEHERADLVSLLIERGADILAQTSEQNISPLCDILESGFCAFTDVIFEALKNNVDLQKRVERETGITLLHVACSKMDIDSVMELLDNGANINAQVHENAFIWQKYTCLHVLMFADEDWAGDDENISDIIKLLLSRGVDLTLTNSKGDTPIHTAYRKLYLELDNPILDDIILLLKGLKSFDVNPASIENLTHFHIACHMLEYDVVKAFLEQEVDVNLRINVFCDSQIAASTPLHLAAELVRDLNEIDVTNPYLKFAQSKIVDLLIKNGADVNAEDSFGNTPAHYVSSCSTFKEDILQRLVNAGADVNVRNVRGETTLERLIKKEKFTFQEVRHWINCGCRFNEFNLVTGKGYIASADSVLTHTDMQALLVGAFVNSPDCVKVDNTKRTVIHNIVSNDKQASDQAQYVELFDLLVSFGCDIDDQDALGRTALHLAAQFRNESAITGLIAAGADINITDNSNKTPFAYIFEKCSQCPDKNNTKHDQYSHSKLFKTFMSHIKRMELCNTFVNQSNQHLMIKAAEKFNIDDIMNELNEIFMQFAQISKMKIEPYPLTAADFLLAAAVVDYPMMSSPKRKVIDAFFQEKRRSFQKNFKQTAALLQFQYRQALLRWKIINKAIESLCMLAKCRMPDICSHMILRWLKNFELQNLIASTVNIGLTNVDVKSEYEYRGKKLKE